MCRVWWIIAGLVYFVFDEVVFTYHLDIRIISIDMNRTTQGDRYRSITCEQSPPDAFPSSKLATGSVYNVIETYHSLLSALLSCELSTLRCIPEP